jgi:Carboxypeptidase regulatory-like domain/TonB dependent receptor
VRRRRDRFSATAVLTCNDANKSMLENGGVVMRTSRIGKGFCLLFVALVLFPVGRLMAGVTASISGTVTDPSGAVVEGATVTATNVDTGVTATQSTNGQGFYSFQSLPVGKYTVAVQHSGFKVYTRTGLVLDVNQALVVDVSVQVGQGAEKVEVSSEALHVDTVSTQMGEVITEKEMTDVPLASRSYTDLLSLQPGVVSAPSGMTGAYSGPFISAGFAAPPVSGSLDSGALSVNGMRESEDGFILNGLLVQEIGFSGAGAIPNLDSLAEFRILTNNADAEYGNYSGGQINVVTKSGTNGYHGSGFEFLRNTDFDSANYFAHGVRSPYHQNQFGGTFGGPVVHDKVFFFADYQGNRVVQGVTQVINGAPSAATEAGNFSGLANANSNVFTTNCSNNQPLCATVVNGGAWASQLTSQLGQTVSSGEPYYYNASTINPVTLTPYGSDCTSNTQCVFPNAQLPTTAFNPISTKLLQYVLPASAGSVSSSTGTGQYLNSSQSINLHDNKFSGRLDANTGMGLLTAYYYFDRFNRVDPYWPGNAPLYPGFGVQGKGQTHDITLADSKTFGAASVNEFRLGYFRLDTKFNQPLGGTGTKLSDLGFASGAGGAPGIFPVAPSLEGVPEIDFNNFVIGVPSRPNGLIDNIYQVLDNYSRVIGTHTLKFGGEYHYDQLEEDLIDNVSNGNFFFGTQFNGGSSETGSDFVDFLLGAPSSYVQGQSYPSYGRNFYFGLYAQDSWRAKKNLTINYGLRYDVSAPWAEKYHEIQTLIPGEQSVVFPGAPKGWVFPGDPHVPNSLAPTRWNNFAPRLGLAYSFGEHEGMLGKLLGSTGSTSLRLGWGMFYSTFEGATDFNEIGDAPFGNYTGQFGSTFAAPFMNRATGVPIKNFFPAPAPPLHFSASHPASGFPYDNLSDFFSAFGTIGSSPAFYNGNRLPYAEEYELSIQHQITTADLVTMSYVGTEGHRLLSSMSANPGSPALCLATPGCGPGGENNIYTPAVGPPVIGTRLNFPGLIVPAGAGSLAGTPIVPFGNDSYFITAGNSSYNSAQINYRHTSGRLQTLVGYTFSKSFDDSSGYGEQINPINPRISRGLSAFDSTHNFVASYSYRLPLDNMPGPKRLMRGWSISGITRFSTGLPVTMIESDDRSLLGTAFGGPITQSVDTPNFIGPLQITDPRKSIQGQYFNASAFGPSVLGQEGNSRRRFFHGPGTNNWDLALLKNTDITERVNLQFRAEFFNLFNHTQFLAPSGITGFSGGGAPTSGSFGDVTSAQSPRIGQMSLKLSF